MGKKSRIKRRARQEEIPPEVERLIQRARHSKARKHHLVPAFYLEAWADEGRLRVTERGSRRSYLTTPSKAARETDFYRAEAEALDPEIIPPLFPEMLLEEIEKRAVVAVRKVQQAGIVGLSDELMFWLALFVAFQLTRGRAFRQQFAAMTNATHKLLLSYWNEEHIRSRLEELGEPVTDERVQKTQGFIRDFLDGKYVVEPQQPHQIGMAGSAAMEMVPYLLERNWFTFRGMNLITCDEPAVAVGGPPYERSDAFGVGNAGAIIFPLDPRLLLVMFHPAIAIDDVGALPTLLPSEEGELNREIGASATRWLFEKPGTKQAQVLGLPPPRPNLRNLEGPRKFHDGEEEGELFRWSTANPWTTIVNPPPWPIRSLVAGTS